jgi:thioredoxin 1
MSSTIKLDEANFDSTIKNSDIPILVDFWAPWCGPCRTVAPVLEELANDLKGTLTIGKVNTDENPIVSSKFGIQSIPTMLLFKGGTVAAQFVGAMRKDQLMNNLKPHLDVKA